MTFGEKVKFVRNSLFLTQAQMAKRMSVTENTVRKWEKDKSSPRSSSIRTLNNICKTENIRIP